MKIHVRDLVGANAITMEDGDAVYSRIHGPLSRGDSVCLDFTGVEVFASPFFNAGIGRLLADIPSDVLNDHLAFDHMSAFGGQVMRSVIDNAKGYYSQSSTRRSAIDRIVHDSTMAA